jgi:drug/metabolite transporter (DMT)-like permease
MPPEVRDRVLLGILYRTLGALGWACVTALVKWASESGAGLVQIVFFRNAVALVVITALILSTAGPSALRTFRPWMHFRRGALGLGAISFGFAAVTLMPLTEATAVGFTAPLFVTALSAPLLKERVTRRQWLAVLVGFAGVLVMIRPDPHHLANLGAVLALVGALGAAASTITVRDLGRTERGPTIVFYFLLFAALVSAVPLPFTWKPLTLEAWIALIAIGALSAGVQLLLTQSVRIAAPAKVAPFDYTQLITAGLIGWLVWEEQLRAATLAGALIVIGSGLYILWTETRRAAPKP